MAMKVSSIDEASQAKKGLLLIDKPEDWTSHDVVGKVRRLTGVKKVGHAGTLDPLATGLLIVLVGREFTKLQSQFLKQDKEYLVSARLGVVTDSYDAHGQITSEAEWSSLKEIDQENLLAILEKFKGTISQQVPIFSAVKVKGEKLYNKARAGKTAADVSLPVRKVEIKSLELISFSKDEQAKQASFSLRVSVSSGTYIRSLVHDIGQLLEVGAHVVSLRRTKIGDLSVEQAQNLS